MLYHLRHQEVLIDCSGPQCSVHLTEKSTSKNTILSHNWTWVKALNLYLFNQNSSLQFLDSTGWSAPDLTQKTGFRWLTTLLYISFFWSRSKTYSNFQNIIMMSAQNLRVCNCKDLVMVAKFISNCIALCPLISFFSFFFFFSCCITNLSPVAVLALPMLLHISCFNKPFTPITHTLIENKLFSWKATMWI